MKILEARRSLKFKLGLLARQRWCVGSDMGRKQTSPKLERRVSKEVQRIRNSIPSTDTCRFMGTPIEFLMIAALPGFVTCLCARGQRSDDGAQCWQRGHTFQFWWEWLRITKHEFIYFGTWIIVEQNEVPIFHISNFHSEESSCVDNSCLEVNTIRTSQGTLKFITC